VLSRDGKAIDASKDHKPNDRRERERIEKLGGKVSEWDVRFEQLDKHNTHKKNYRLNPPPLPPQSLKVSWYGYRDKLGRPIPGSGVYRINGNLAVARAIGDRSESPFVSSSVEVLSLDLDAEVDQFVIVASDGLWDVMSSQEAVTFVNDMMRGGVGALPKGGKGGKGKGTRPASIRISDWTTNHSDDR
jgi:serine/threonine protein phosphatase PrpC